MLPASAAAPASSTPGVVKAFARLSTSLKILILLSVALLPLGLIASLASLETARANRANREAAAHLLATDSAERFNLIVDSTTNILHDAQRGQKAGCRRASASIGFGSTVALFDGDGRLICASRALTATLPLRPPSALPMVMIDPDDAAVRMLVRAADAPGWALAVLPRDLLASAVHPHALDGSYWLRLDDSSKHSLVLATIDSIPLGREVLSRLPIAGGQLGLSMRVASPPLSANEILLTLLPVLMWVSAAAIGWLVVDRLILRPLASMQDAIEVYRLSGQFVPPPLTTPALEIRALGRAFQRAAQTITHHEAELEEGLARQTKLTREVHHRVKNNLQVVASLLNIHARGASVGEAADAYATIQRRVDALALVHRSHYAELEVNQGIALRPLIGEIAANLRASLPGGARAPQIMLDLAQFNANQDVAVSVAFLLVETIETAMIRVAGTTIAIALRPLPDRAERARLTIASPALAREAASVDDAYTLFERVVTGLSRQLRSPLERDEERGTLAIEIAVLAPLSTASQQK